MRYIVEPSAPILVESLRAFGYTLETAIADLIDNSISAGANEIYIDFHWNGSKSVITVSDNGNGINEKEINQVMKFGSQSPTESRKNNDLGRFGLGLKTASLSQAKSFSVFSKTNLTNYCSRQWDIDYIKKLNNWELLVPSIHDYSQYLKYFEHFNHGTVIVWEKMDKIVSTRWNVENYNDECKFIELKLKVKEHIEMVFHRFLEGKFPYAKFYLDGEKLYPWDPFCEMNQATDRTPEENISFGNDVVKIKGFILPHKDKLSAEVYDNFKGPKGWNGQQGFYIYRNKRMLVSGNWLGLGDNNRPWTKEEQYKLARIRVDIPNSLDTDWNIDVKKSSAKPPLLLKKRLVTLAQDVRSRAREVFSYRGQYKKRSKELAYDSIWKSNSINGKRNYYLDRKHSLIKLINQTTQDKEVFELLLQIIEQTVPVERIWLETAEQPENHARSFENIKEDAIKESIQKYLDVLVNSEGMNRESAIKKILNTDGFRYYEDIVKKL